MCNMLVIRCINDVKSLIKEKVPCNNLKLCVKLGQPHQNLIS